MLCGVMQALLQKGCGWNEADAEESNKDDCYEKRMRDVEMFSLGKMRLREDIALFKYLKAVTWKRTRSCSN